MESCTIRYLQELSDFIDSNPDPRKLKRALAVMMWIEGIPGSEIQKILNVSATLLDEAKISWKKTQKKNPKKNDEFVETKKREYSKKTARR